MIDKKLEEQLKEVGITCVTGRPAVTQAEPTFLVFSHLSTGEEITFTVHKNNLTFSKIVDTCIQEVKFTYITKGFSQGCDKCKETIKEFLGL